MSSKRVHNYLQSKEKKTLGALNASVDGKILRGNAWISWVRVFDKVCVWGRTMHLSSEAERSEDCLVLDELYVFGELMLNMNKMRTTMARFCSVLHAMAIRVHYRFSGPHFVWMPNFMWLIFPVCACARSLCVSGWEQEGGNPNSRSVLSTEGKMLVVPN